MPSKGTLNSSTATPPRRIIKTAAFQAPMGAGGNKTIKTYVKFFFLRNFEEAMLGGTIGYGFFFEKIGSREVSENV